MNDRNKILIIENSIAITGSLQAVLRTSIALRDKYEFIFIVPAKSQAAYLITENKFKLYERSLYELNKSFTSILFYVPRLIRSAYHVKMIVQRERISIVHVNDFYNLIMPLCRLFGSRTCYLCSVNFVPSRFPFLLRKLWIGSHFLFSSKIVAVSNYVLKQLPLHKKIVCIPDALPNVNIGQDTLVKKKELLLFLGNFINGKGQDLAIRAFATFAPLYPSWKLKFVGGDMGLKKNKVYKSDLQNLSIKLGIEKQIEMTGFARDVAREYCEAAISLNFSLSESFSLTVQEAMFYGSPIIATRSGGPSELIEDGYSGLLVPLNDIEKMSAAIQFLINNPAERERLKTNAALSIRERFHKSKTIDLLDQAYQDLLQNC